MMLFIYMVLALAQQFLKGLWYDLIHATGLAWCYNSDDSFNCLYLPRKTMLNMCQKFGIPHRHGDGAWAAVRTLWRMRRQIVRFEKSWRKFVKDCEKATGRKFKNNEEFIEYIEATLKAQNE